MQYDLLIITYLIIIDTYYLFFYLPVWFAISSSALSALGPTAIVCIMAPLLIAVELQTEMSSVASPSVRNMISSPNTSSLSVASTWWLENREHLPWINYTRHILQTIKLTINMAPLSLDRGLYTRTSLHLLCLATVWWDSLVWSRQLRSRGLEYKHYY